MRPNGNPFLYSVFLASLTILFISFGFSVPSANATALADACSSPAIPSWTDATEWTVPDSSSCYSVYFDEPAAWFVRAATGPASSGVYLELPACSRDAGLQVLDRRLDSLLLDVREAGWRSVCFGQIDRAGDPVEVTLISRAIAESAMKNDPHEQDPDPDPLMGGGCNRTFLAEKNDPHEQDPDPDPLMGGGCNRTFLAEKNDPHEQDPDPDPFMGGCDDSSTLARICQVADSWGDTQIPACAPVWRSQRWADGLLRIVIDQWQQLRIEAASSTDLAVRDLAGQLLARTELLGTDDDDFVVNLAPGEYLFETSGSAICHTRSTF